MVTTMDPYDRILGFLDWSSPFFLPSSSSIVLKRLSGPCSRPATSENLLMLGIKLGDMQNACDNVLSMHNFWDIILCSPPKVN
jgi:hypothetical protein